MASSSSSVRSAATLKRFCLGGWECPGSPASPPSPGAWSDSPRSEPLGEGEGVFLRDLVFAWPLPFTRLSLGFAAVPFLRPIVM